VVDHDCWSLLCVYESWRGRGGDAFRRAGCNYHGLILGLYGIDTAAQYAIELIDEKGEKTTRTITGAELSGDLQFRIPDKSASLVVRYKKQ